jgi:hypothetical protein
MDSVCQQGNVQAGTGSIMAWRVCSWSDMETLKRLDTTLTEDTYVRVLADHLPSLMSIVHSDGLGQFQQDNETLHTPIITTELLQEHTSELKHLHWQPNFSDMIITKHIWDALQYAVQKRSLPPRTLTDLLTALLAEYCQFPSALLQTLFDSVVLWHFRVLARAIYDNRQLYQSISLALQCIYVQFI